MSAGTLTASLLGLPGQDVPVLGTSKLGLKSLHPGLCEDRRVHHPWMTPEKKHLRFQRTSAFLMTESRKRLTAPSTSISSHAQRSRRGSPCLYGWQSMVIRWRSQRRQGRSTTASLVPLRTLGRRYSWQDASVTWLSDPMAQASSRPSAAATPKEIAIPAPRPQQARSLPPAEPYPDAPASDQ